MKHCILARVLALALTLPTCAAASATEQPNVIYILADDLGYGDLSCYGQTKLKTPNIDRLANEGIRFVAHYSGNTVCSPSRAVLMTGKHSGRVYLRGNLTGEVGSELDPELTVLPELFKAAGYATGAFGKWGLGHANVEGPQNPLSHGFDEFYGWKTQGTAHTYFPTTAIHNGKEVPLKPGTYFHDLVMDRARDFIRRNASADQPFFCYIPTAIPHAAMQAPRDLHDKWRKRFSQFDDVIGTYRAGDEPCPDVRNPIAGFAAMMENLDNEVGSILALLEELGVDETTLVMFSSDNGAHKEGGHDPVFWNSTGGLRGHKRDMHEGGIRVPMLARWSGVIEPESVTDHISGFQDVLPTIAQLIGQSDPPDIDGISFLPTLLGDSERQSEHEYLYWEFCRGPEQQIFSQAVRSGRWKAYLRAGQKMQLFDLDEDPFEKSDISDFKANIVARLKQFVKDAHKPLATQAITPQWVASPELIEQFTNRKYGQEFGVNYKEDDIEPFVLPELLMMKNGSRVDDPDQWRRRRAEILESFLDHVVGRAPLERPERMTFKIVKQDSQAVNGKAVRKDIEINFTGQPSGPRADVRLYTPADSGEPVPTFLYLGRSLNATAPPQPRWQNVLPDLMSRGYGLAVVDREGIDPDKDDGFKNGVHGAFDPAGERPDDAWGTVAAWAWGLSRTMDYLETDADVDAERIGVMGVSRAGKTALWAGARDERFALTIGICSGCTGAALSRRRIGNQLEVLNSKNPHWFCANYAKFNDKEHLLPIDQHMLLSLIAPRLLYVTSADEDLWADPRGEFLGASHTEPVYRLLGCTGLGSDTMPSVNNPVRHGRVGYHIRSGGHGLERYDWMQILEFTDKHWRN